MFFGAFLALIYVATSRISFVLIRAVMFVIGAWVLSATVGHVGDRVDIWLDPFGQNAPERPVRSPSRFTPRPTAGCSAAASGPRCSAPGPFKPDCSTPFPDCGSLLPAPRTDFIYAVIVNELGVFGAAAVVIIYILIAERGFKTAVLAREFGKLLAAGLDGGVRDQGVPPALGRRAWYSARSVTLRALHQLRRELDRRQHGPVWPAARDLDRARRPPAAGRPRGRAARSAMMTSSIVRSRAGPGAVRSTIVEFPSYWASLRRRRAAAGAPTTGAP